MTNPTDIPQLRLRPKKSPQRFRRGAPWVFADEVVLDRRTRAIEAGSLVQVTDEAREPFALATINPGSKIIARILDHDPEAVLDAAWFEARIARALELRETLYDAPFYRLIHAEADGCPGLIVDRFGDQLVMQPNTAWADRNVDTISAALLAVTGARSIYLNASSRARRLEGLDDAARALAGDVPGTLDVPMNGATYRADIAGGQKTGLFFDQRDNHAAAARFAKGRRMLDVFCHVGGFGLASLAAGATDVLALDSSQPALDLATEGAVASGFGDRFATRTGDAVASLRALNDEDRRFGLVVCDPPAFAPHKEALEAGLRGYERVANHGAKLVEPGGYLVLCSCSQAADPAAFRTACLTGIGRARRRAQLLMTGGAGPDHPAHTHLADTGYLKALFFRLD